MQTDKEMTTLNAEAAKFTTPKAGGVSIAKDAVDAQLAIAAQNMAMKEAVATQQLFAEGEAKSQKAQTEGAKQYETLYNEVAGSRISDEDDALAKIVGAEKRGQKESNRPKNVLYFDYAANEQKMYITTQQYLNLMTGATEEIGSRAGRDRSKVRPRRCGCGE